MFTFGSLFAGIGGLDLGLERAGMVCKWQVELDPYCRAVLEKHWPDVPRWDDATTFLAQPGRFNGDARGRPHEKSVSSPASDVERRRCQVDLICGGFPCQPVSHAGKRTGTSDARWLWPEFARILGVLRPRYALIENVPGLLTANDGGAFSEVLGDLARLGYDAEWTSVPAAAVGAPHLRYRVFVVAYANRGRQLQSQRCKSDLGRWAGNGSEDVADAAEWAEGFVFRQGGRPGQGEVGGASGTIGRFDDWWATEPDVRGMANGIPQGLDGGLDGGDRVDTVGRATRTAKDCVRIMWEQWAALGSSPQGREPDEQLARKLSHALSSVSHENTLEDRKSVV